MIDQVAAAFDRQDYQTVAKLLKQWLKQSPTDPWARLYVGKLREVSGKLEAAESVYRHLLQETASPKLAMQARQGLQRLASATQAQRQNAIAQATANPMNTGLGFLILEPLDSEAKTAVAKSFARIMKLDPYTARLHLPSRGWRLYRTGTIGELQVYGQELRAANIPAFWAPLDAIQNIRVFRVNYLEATSPQATVVCQNETGQMGALTFDWSEVSDRVEGLLPIFEDVVDVGVRHQLKWKEKTQDYAQICDLHLPERNCILRFCDLSYQFHQGVVFDPSQDGSITAEKASTRIKWNTLLDFLNHHLTEVHLWSDFTPFAETALDQLELVRDFEPYIDLFRKAPTHWDPAFHLYSGLVFAHKEGKKHRA